MLADVADTPVGGHPRVKVLSVSHRRSICLLRLVQEADVRVAQVRERQLALEDLLLEDGRVVIGAWDDVELTLYVWAPHMALYETEVLRGLALELAFGVSGEAAPVQHSEGTRILLVEDDAMLARAVQRILEQEGFVVTTTASPFEFRQLLERERPALVLVDVQLPAITGDVLVQLVQIGEGGHRCPMVLFSGAPEAELEDLVRSSGAAGYIRKVGRLADLAERARAFIDRS